MARTASDINALWAIFSWRQTPWLAGVRDEAELAKLPKAEADAWRSFWSEVDAFWREIR